MAAGSLVAAAVLVVLPGRAATADSVTGVQASIAALQSEVATQAVEIHTLTGAYQAAMVQSASLAQQITTDRASLATMRAQESATRSALRTVALRSYTDGQGAPGSITSASDAAVQDEYLSVASGDVGDTVDRLGVQQRQVRRAQDTVALAQQANATAVAAAAAARTQALATAGQEQDHLTALQSQLQQLVTAQSLAQAQAAATARATQGAPVNGGLVSAVRTLVSAPTALAPVEPAPSDTAPTPASPVVTTPVPSGPAPTTPTTAPGATLPSPAPTDGATAQDFAELRQCESGGNYAEDTGNGFYGAYQFDASTWTDLGFPGRPDQEPAAMQDQAAEQLQARSGWGQWPACSAALGLS